MRPTEPGYRENVFNRVLKACHIQEGDYVKVKGTPKRGQVIKKHLVADEAQWKDNRPLLLEIKVDEMVYAVHPSQLKRVNSL